MEGRGDAPAPLADDAAEGIPAAIRLPLLASDSLGTQQPGASAAPSPQAGAEEFAEEDLFGSAEEDQEAVEPPAAAEPAAPSGGVAAGSAAGAGSSGPGGDELPDEADLFGESEPGDDLDERALFGSEDEGGAEIDERALFGSDDEEDGKPARADQAAGQAAPQSPAHSELSEMDEREIFGEVSDDEPEKVEDVILRRRPAPSTDRIFMSMRLPNVLSIDKNAYSADNIPQTALEGYRSFLNTQNRSSTRLLNPENCVRWRFKKGPDGHNLTDEDGRPQYESNSRLVEWEDGSKTLYVGSEAFDITEIDDRVVLFEENSQDVHVCHGTVNTRLVATPRNLESVTHDMLKRSQYHKFEANRRSLLMSQEEQDAHQQLLEIQADQKQKQRRDEMREKRSLQQGPEALTAAFLEDDQATAGGIGPSVKEIKEQAKRQRLG